MDRKEGLYLFTKDGLKEATQGYDKQQVCAELARRGFLVTNEDKRLTYKRNIPGLSRLRLRLYAVRFSLLEETDGDPYRGQSPLPTERQPGQRDNLN